MMIKFCLAMIKLNITNIALMKLVIRWRTCNMPVNEWVQALPKSIGPVVLRMASKRLQDRPRAVELVGIFGGLVDVTPIPDASLELLAATARQESGVRAALATAGAAKRNLSQVRHLVDLFRSLDKDGNGSIDAEEVRAVLASRKGKEGLDIDTMVKNLVGDSGSIQYKEFVARLSAQEASREHEVLSRQFAELDVDGDGIVSTAELAALLARPDIHYSEELDAAAVIAEIDKNRDGKVTFEEFARFMAGNEPVVKSAAEL